MVQQLAVVGEGAHAMAAAERRGPGHVDVRDTGQHDVVEAGQDRHVALGDEARTDDADAQPAHAAGPLDSLPPL